MKVAQLPNNQWLYKQSYVYLQCGKYEQALILLNAIVQVQPGDTNAIKMLIVGLVSLERYREAKQKLAHLHQLPEFSPVQWPEFYLLSARVSAALGERDDVNQMLADYQEARKS